jgi:hypothetical protein
MNFRMSLNHPSAPPGGARAAGPATGRHWGRILACLAVTAALAGAVGPGQQNVGKPNRTTISSNGAFPLPDANKQMELHQQQTNKQNFELINTERRKIIGDESALLLKLATDLKTEVDKTNKDTLSLDVIRKADTIEKLAHDVKDKMKLSVGAS